MRVLLSWLGATVLVVLARPAVAGPRFVSDDPEPTPFSSVHIRPVHSRRMPYLGALARMALIPPAASPYGVHDLLETQAARAGKDQGRTTRDAGRGRPQYCAARA
jgi:hypothetical protein